MQAARRKPSGEPIFSEVTQQLALLG